MSVHSSHPRHRKAGHRSLWLRWLLLMLVLGAVVGGALWLERQRLVDVELERLLVQARVVERNMDRQLEGANSALLSVLRDLAYFESPSTDEQKLHLRLQALSDAMPGVRTLNLLDATGVVLASNRAELVGRDFGDRPYFQMVARAADPQRLYLSQPFKTVLNVYSMNLLRVQLNDQGQLNRVVAATLDPGFFEILLASVLYSDDMWSAIGHGEGRLVVQQPDRPDLIGKDLNQPGSAFAQHLASGQSATTLRGLALATGEQVLMAQRTIEARSLKMVGQLVVAVARRQSSVFKGWTEVAVGAAVAWLLIGLGSGLGLRHLLRQRAQVRALRHEKEGVRQQAEADMRQLAYHDALTQLPNRRLLMDRLVQLQAAGLRHGRCSALFFLDLDGFKQLNDNHGHDQGDRLMQAVAQRLRDSVREEDTVARLGGDEFVLMLFELGGQPVDARMHAEAVAVKVLKSLDRPYRLEDPLAGPEGLAYRCTASIGVTLFGLRPEPVDDILKRADAAMYEAKAAGRNTFRFASSGSGSTIPPTVAELV